jgi:hypothetical protein
VNARAFVLREHTMRRAAEGYLDVLRDVTGLPLDHALVQEPKTQVRMEKPPRAPMLAASSREADAPELSTDSLLAPVADALAEIGLDGDMALIEQAAKLLAEMRIGVPRKE